MIDPKTKNEFTALGSAQSYRRLLPRKAKLVAANRHLEETPPVKYDVPARKMGRSSLAMTILIACRLPTGHIAYSQPGIHGGLRSAVLFAHRRLCR